jgi:hypothetical protein
MEGIFLSAVDEVVTPRQTESIMASLSPEVQ